jgi:hypothetical protein
VFSFGRKASPNMNQQFAYTHAPAPPARETLLVQASRQCSITLSPCILNQLLVMIQCQDQMLRHFGNIEQHVQNSLLLWKTTCDFLNRISEKQILSTININFLRHPSKFHKYFKAAP